MKKINTLETFISVLGMILFVGNFFIFLILGILKIFGVAAISYWMIFLPLYTTLCMWISSLKTLTDND
jgi:hypothetical protein